MLLQKLRIPPLIQPIILNCFVYYCQSVCREITPFIQWKVKAVCLRFNQPQDLLDGQKGSQQILTYWNQTSKNWTNNNLAYKISQRCFSSRLDNTNTVYATWYTNPSNLFSLGITLVLGKFCLAFLSLAVTVHRCFK